MNQLVILRREGRCLRKRKANKTLGNYKSLNQKSPLKVTQRRITNQTQKSLINMNKYYQTR